jgi:Ran GTPase-activating protein (RanGAP) involved in mRNA processing and transport
VQRAGESLTVLDISNFEKITWNLMQEFHFPNLVELNLFNCGVRDEHLAKTFQRGMPKLEILNLGQAVSISDQFLRELGKKQFPNLRVINLRMCYISDSGIQAMLQGTPNLEEIDIGTLPYQGLATLGRVSDVTLSCIAQKCPKIRRICICGRRSLTCTGILILLDNCNELQTLDVTLCPAVMGNNFLILSSRKPTVNLVNNSGAI